MRTKLLLLLGVVVLGALAVGSVGMLRVQAANRKDACMWNVRKLVTAELMYACDYNEAFPRAATWMDDLMRYVSLGRPIGQTPAPGPAQQKYEVKPRAEANRTFRCPADSHFYSYSMNSALSGKYAGDISDPSATAMVFESDSGRRNAFGPYVKFTDPARHGGGGSVAYANGFAKFVR